MSSVSDFENFAQKIKEQISITVKEIETESAAYLLQKEHETAYNIDAWLKQEEIKWNQAYNAQKQQSRNLVEGKMNAEWFTFKKERRLALRSALKRELEEIFPVLAECFISTVVQKYQKGIFTMPERYFPSVETEGFILNVSEKEEIIFTSENLFIEYSLERIMEELDDDITLGMEETWQA